MPDACWSRAAGGREGNIRLIDADVRRVRADSEPVIFSFEVKIAISDGSGRRFLIARCRKFLLWMNAS